MKTSAQHIRHITRPQEFSMPGSVAAVHLVSSVRTEVNLEPGFHSGSSLARWQKPNKATSILFFFCEIYCFHIKRFFRGEVFFLTT